MSFDDHDHVYTYKPIEWISIAIVSLLAALINAYILKNELTRRKSQPTEFRHKRLRLWSSMTLISWTLWSLMNCIEYFPILCHFCHPLDNIFVNLATCMVGFYQLERLYFCFSSNSVFSKKGYSTCTFVVMYSVGTIITIFNTFIHAVHTFDVSGQCGLNSKYEYVAKLWTQHWILYHWFAPIWIYVGLLIFLVWDWLTLALYTFKALQIRRYVAKYSAVHGEAQMRVMGILKRVIFMTAFYEVGVLSVVVSLISYHYVASNVANQMLVSVVKILYECSWALMSVMMSYSVYLMQQYNTEPYVAFLKKMNMCCCCLWHIENDYHVHSSLSLPETQKSANFDGKDDSVFDTKSVPVKQRHSAIAMEPTLTVDADVEQIR